MLTLTDKGEKALETLQGTVDRGGMDSLTDVEVEIYAALTTIQEVGDFPDELEYGLVKLLRGSGFVSLTEVDEGEDQFE